MPPELDALADEFHVFLNGKFKEAGQFSPYPGGWDTLPEVAKLSRRAAAEWAMTQAGNGVAKETVEKYQQEYERLRLALEEREARAATAESNFKEAMARAADLEAQVAMPMEPVDIESLIPLTRDQDVEALVQTRATLDGRMLGAKEIKADLKKLKMRADGQTIFMGALGVGIFWMLVSPK